MEAMPPRDTEKDAEEKFNDFNYWKADLIPLDEDLPDPSSTAASKSAALNEGGNAPQADVDTKAIVLKNIPFSMKRDEFLAILVEKSILPIAFSFHYDNKIFHGIAFANFATDAEAMDALSKLDGLEVGGRTIKAEVKRRPSPEQRQANRLRAEKLREERATLEKEIEAFLASSETEKHYPATLTKEVRSRLHQLADKYNLNHRSDGEGDQRRLKIWKKDPSELAQTQAAAEFSPSKQSTAPVATAWVPSSVPSTTAKGELSRVLRQPYGPNGTAGFDPRHFGEDPKSDSLRSSSPHETQRQTKGKSKTSASAAQSGRPARQGSPEIFSLQQQQRVASPVPSSTSTPLDGAKSQQQQQPQSQQQQPKRMDRAATRQLEQNYLLNSMIAANAAPVSPLPALYGNFPTPAYSPSPVPMAAPLNAYYPPAQPYYSMADPRGQYTYVPTAAAAALPTAAPATDRPYLSYSGKGGTEERPSSPQTVQTGTNAPTEAKQTRFKFNPNAPSFIPS